MRKQITSVVIALLALVNLAGTAFAQGPCQTVVVSPANLAGWAFITSSADGVAAIVASTPPQMPGGTSAARLFTGTHGEEFAEIRNSNFAGVDLASLSELSYCTYVTQFNGAQVPFLALNVDTDGNGTVDDILIFEPEYSNGVYNPSIPAQPAVALNTWQCWDALNGGWYSNILDTNSGPGADVKPLSYILDQYPNEGADAQIVNNSEGLGGVRIISGFGSPTDVFNAYVDNVMVATGSDCVRYDFQLFTVPTDKDQCKNGGWMTFNPPGGPFKNQGDCIQFFKP